MIYVDSVSFFFLLQDHSATTITSATMHSQAMVYARLAKSPTLKTASLMDGGAAEKLNDDTGLLTVLPVSAESSGLLPNRSGNFLIFYY